MSSFDHAPPVAYRPFNRRMRLRSSVPHNADRVAFSHRVGGEQKSGVTGDRAIRLLAMKVDLGSSYVWLPLQREIP